MANCVTSQRVHALQKMADPRADTVNWSLIRRMRYRAQKRNHSGRRTPSWERALGPTPTEARTKRKQAIITNGSRGNDRYPEERAETQADGGSGRGPYPRHLAGRVFAD